MAELVDARDFSLTVENLSAQREISDVELRKFGGVLDEFKDRLMMIIPSQSSSCLFTDKLEVCRD